MLGRPVRRVNSTRPSSRPLKIQCTRAGFSSTGCAWSARLSRIKTFLTKGSFAVEAGGGAEFLFDAEELVVFGDAIGAAGGASLDLAGGGGDGEVGDKGVLGFAGAMGNDGVVAGFACQFDGVDGFGDAADLVQLDENGVGDAFVDAAGKALGIGDEEVVADELDSFLG